MEFDFGFEAKLEYVKIKKIKKFDRIWKWSYGGSITFHILDNGTVYFSSMDRHLYAVDVKSGQIKWKFKTNGELFASPSNVVNEKIAIADYKGLVYLIDINTGKEISRYQTGGQIAAMPIIDNDLIYVTARDGFLYTIDTNGNLKWMFKTGDQLSHAVLIHDKKAFFGGFDNYFYCLDKNTGQELWRIKTGGEIVCDQPCLINNDIVYFSSWDNFLYAADANSGRILWQFKAGKYGMSGPAIKFNDMLLFPSRDGMIFAITLEGQELWRFKAGSLVISVTASENEIFFTSEDGFMYALNEFGSELWRFAFGEGGSYDFPSYVDGKILVGSMDCHFYAIDALTHEELWRVTTDSQSRSTAPPPNDEFAAEIKKSVSESETVFGEEKYAVLGTLNLSEYNTKSEYMTKSEYTHKSEYTTDFVIFEGVLEWNLSSVILEPKLKIFK